MEMGHDLDLSEPALRGVMSLLDYGRDGEIRAILSMQLDRLAGQ